MCVRDFFLYQVHLLFGVIKNIDIRRSEKDYKIVIFSKFYHQLCRLVKVALVYILF